MADSPAPETPRTPDDAPADDAQGAAPGTVGAVPEAEAPAPETGGAAPTASGAAPESSGAAAPAEAASSGASTSAEEAASPEASGSRPVPSAEDLERLAVDVRVRRRPRYGVFIALGILVAGVAALVWAMSVPQSAHANWGSTIWVTVLGAMGFGALIGAGAGVFADWLSRRK